MTAMMKRIDGNRFFGICLVVGILSTFLFSFSVRADGPPRVKMDGPVGEPITVGAKKSVILDSPGTIKRVSVADPSLADVVVVSPRQVYLTGKAPGATSLTIWGSSDAVYRIYDVEVVPDVNRLKERLHKVLPQEKNIQVMAAHDYLTVAGTVSSAETQAQVLELASAFAPVTKEGKPRIMNLLQVGGVQQVMLEVRVSEMSRTLARRLGFNFTMMSASGEQIGLSLLNNLTRLPTDGPWPAYPLTVTDNIAGIVRFLGGDASWTVFIDALKENGMLKILAEPTLTTLSGKEAKFHAGGEYPVPIPQAIGSSTIVTIEYKPYGVRLGFTPTVLSNGKISMSVSPEVSELDFANTVSLQGYIIPSVTVRKASATVEMADGQSFAIAGLLKEETRETIRKYPLLGEIPVLGALFRSSSYQRQDTELIIIVTPHLVKPLDMARQTLPTDQFTDPNDFEFYLLGITEGYGAPKRRPSPVADTAPPAVEPQQSGRFGHSTPQ